MSKATAINLKTLEGNDYLFCEEDGFSSESLVNFLREQLGKEFTWIEDIKVEILGWDKTTLNLQEVYNEILKETNG